MAAYSKRNTSKRKTGFSSGTSRCTSGFFSADFLLVFFIVLVLIFSYGCAAPSTGGGKKVDYHTGTKGIEINYAQGSPPNNLYDKIQTQVALEVWNRGAEAASGTIFFDGFDPAIFQGMPSQVSLPSVDGKEGAQNPQGGYYFLDVSKSVTPNLPEDTDYLPIPLRATVCYSYTTAASIKVCIDPDPSKQGTKACTPSNPSVGGGQGGPVGVGAVQQDSGVGQTIFTITIKNVGGGRVISNTKVASCNQLSYADYDEVAFSASISQGKGLDCGSKGNVRLVNGQANIVCKTPTDPKQGAYVTTLKINLNYGYTYSTVKNVEIRRI